jgi:uncharacterized protein YutE (UPF0331/DUF86 family)
MTEKRLSEQAIIVRLDRKKTLDTVSLVRASTDSCIPYDLHQEYTPKEREPYDALADRFVRAVEVSLKFMRSYERYMYAENSDTVRDLLNRMEKAGLITSSESWLRMRDVRNRIVHDYLPEDIKKIYDDIMGEMATELIRFSEKAQGLPL